MPPIHAHKVHGTCSRDGFRRAERLGKKGAEAGFTHLAGRHGELTMPTFGICVAIDLHVVGWVQKCRVDRRTLSDHAPKKLRIAPVAATDAMLAENPDV